MAIPQMVGSPLFPNSDANIIPNCVVDCSAGDHNATAGNIVKNLNSPTLGILQDDVENSQVMERALVCGIQGYMYATAAAIAKGDPLIAVRQGAGVDENHWWLRTAVGGEAIHCRALAAKALNADPSVVLAEGPYNSPYDTV